MTKLLHKPLKAFAIYALIMLACSIPAYYLIIDSIWNEEIDERNKIESEQIALQLNQIASESELRTSIEIWNKIQLLSSIHKDSLQSTTPDSTYNVQREISENGEKEIEHFRGLFKHVRIHGQSYLVKVETNIEEAEDTVLAIALITSILTFILIAGLIYLNNRLARKIWKPFYETIDQLTEIDIGKQRPLIFSKTDIDEFNTLNSSLEKMISKNISIFESQKEFTQNASHELQTPLALAKSKVDLLIQILDLGESDRKTIEELNSSLSRMTRINKNLLLLSKIENTNLERKPVAVDVILENICILFSEYISERNINLTKDFESGNLIDASESLLEILLNNLLSNAIRHNIENGIIIMALERGLFSIKSTGDKALERDLLFKRFVSTHHSKGNSGLGLAIAKEICVKHGWSLDYSFEETLHVFSVKFQVQN